MTISLIRGEVDARYAKRFSELTSGNVAVQSSAEEVLVYDHSCGTEHNMEIIVRY